MFQMIRSASFLCAASFGIATLGVGIRPISAARNYKLTGQKHIANPPNSSSKAAVDDTPSSFVSASVRRTGTRQSKQPENLADNITSDRRLLRGAAVGLVDVRDVEVRDDEDPSDDDAGDDQTLLTLGRIEQSVDDDLAKSDRLLKRTKSIKEQVSWIKKLLAACVIVLLGGVMYFCCGRSNKPASSNAASSNAASSNAASSNAGSSAAGASPHGSKGNRGKSRGASSKGRKKR